MCGLAGILALTDRTPDPEWGARMMRALRHRGPDGEGLAVSPRLVLAHTRLAIIDLTDAGKQPMRSADGRRLLALNGEIYNHASIRERLERDGAAFRSRSDTEVLLTALERRGVGALEDVLGMFAFALYDQDTGELLLARDRLGKKPLLYVRTPEWLAFASEVQALLTLPFVRARMDPESLRDYARYLYVPAPATLIAGIRKLPAGSYLRVRPGVPAEEPRIYWSLPSRETAGPAAQNADRPHRHDGARLDHALDDLLLDATRLRTVSDVPIGVFLSGGIDSNAVLEALHRIGHHPIRAFTVGFEGLPDERPLARLGASRFADEHVELSIRPDVASDVPQILRHFGEPLGDSAIVTTYLIAREASRHVKVILNGDGGDELFGGYARYPFARRLDMLGLIPGGRALSRRLYGGRTYLGPFFESLERRDYAEAARRLTSMMTPSQERDLWSPAFAGTVASENGGHVGNGSSRDLTSALFDRDQRVYLPDDLLVKVDLASMAHGLENRSPFLDHRFFELLAPLPPSARAHPLRTKPVLRRLMKHRLPSKILDAPKRGFQLPLESWLRGPLRPWMENLLAHPEATRPLFREGALRLELERFHAGAADPLAPFRLWSFAVLELWAREYQIEMPL